MFKRRIWIMLLGLMVGCSHLPPSPNQMGTRFWLTPGTAIPLPSPYLAIPIEQQQLLTAHSHGKSYSLMVWLRADETGLTLTGLSSLGIKLFSVRYDPNGIQTQQYIHLPQLPPTNQVLADIMLSYWPLPVWQQQLPAGWTLHDEDNQRILTDDQGNVTAQITYQISHGQRQPVHISQKRFDYQITIQNLD